MHPTSYTAHKSCWLVIVSVGRSAAEAYIQSQQNSWLSQSTFHYRNENAIMNNIFRLKVLVQFNRIIIDRPTDRHQCGVDDGGWLMPKPVAKVKEIKIKPIFWFIYLCIMILLYITLAIGYTFDYVLFCFWDNLKMIWVWRDTMVR